MIQKLKSEVLNSCGIMKLKIIITSRVYQQLFILILLLQNSVSGQIDWAEDDDDPGKFHRFMNKDLKIMINKNTMEKRIFRFCLREWLKLVRISILWYLNGTFGCFATWIYFWSVLHFSAKMQQVQMYFLLCYKCIHVFMKESLKPRSILN